MDETTSRSSDTETVSETTRALTDRLLADAGLTTTDAALYRLLLDLPDSDAGTLAWRLDTPQGAVEKHLRRLVRHRYAAVDGEPPRYRAVDPALALHLDTTRRQHALLDQLARVGRASAAIPALARAVAADRGRSHAPQPPVTVIDPSDVARVRRDVAATAATVLRRSVATPDADALDSAAPTRRVLYRRSLLEDDTTYENVQEAALRGDDTRHLPDPGLDLLAADDHTAIVGHGDHAYLLHPSPLLDLALRSFDLTWDRAVPFGVTGTERAWQISDDDHELLTLLAAGLKDQAIARHLGIGLRTVVRRVGNLSRALDAETRFQAGLQAARRGLL